jgi:membrane protease YdiL (CAAX protease family)
LENEISGSILRIGVSAFLIAIVFIICRVKRLPIKETLALRSITFQNTFLWVSLFVVWVLIEEISFKFLGIPSAQTWTYSLPAIFIRAFGIVLIAPVGEELLFRGLLFKRISDSKLGVTGAILIPAAIFAFIHVQYDILVIVFIFFDGIFYGLARHKTGSVILPILLHCLGNIYAVIERLPS